MGLLEGRRVPGGGGKWVKNWDNCNNIINKIYLKTYIHILNIKMESWYIYYFRTLFSHLKVYRGHLSKSTDIKLTHFFKKTQLNWNKSSTIEFIHLKYTIQWVYSLSHATITIISFRTFSPPQKEISYPSSVNPTFSNTSPDPLQTLIYFLSLWICPFWIFSVYII